MLGKINQRGSWKRNDWNSSGNREKGTKKCMEDLALGGATGENSKRLKKGYLRGKAPKATEREVNPPPREFEGGSRREREWWKKK